MKNDLRVCWLTRQDELKQIKELEIRNKALAKKTRELHQQLEDLQSVIDAEEHIRPVGW